MIKLLIQRCKGNDLTGESFDSAVDGID